MIVIVAYIIVINFLTFCLYGLDKKKAKKRRRRIPERILLGLAVLGGSGGALLGMITYRHKIRKVKFIYGIPIIFLVQSTTVACWTCFFCLYKM